MRSAVAAVAPIAFVGLGPGDPRQITLRAADLLGAADVTFADADAPREALAAHASADPVVFAAGSSAIERARAMAERALAGARVVRVFPGDASLFTSLEEEASALAPLGVPIVIAPGITPLLAAGAFGGVALSRSADAAPSLGLARVIAGSEGLLAWSALARAADALALDCDARALDEVARALAYEGVPSETPATLVVDVGAPEQRRVESTVGALSAALAGEAPRVLVCVGERVRGGAALGWFTRQPLFGRRVVVTRAAEQAGELASALAARGARCVQFASISIGDPPDRGRLLQAAREVGGYGWVVFTSQNGVARFFDALAEVGRDARAFGAARVAAIGPATARALATRGITADLVPARFVGESLAEELVGALGPARPRVLLARALVARDVVPDALRAAGCEVDVVAAYETRPAAPADVAGLVQALEAGAIWAVTFTSPSTVESFCGALGAGAAALLSGVTVASIGPVTSARARDLGLRVDVEATEHSQAGLVQALERAGAPEPAAPPAPVPRP